MQVVSAMYMKICQTKGNQFEMMMKASLQAKENMICCNLTDYIYIGLKYKESVCD